MVFKLGKKYIITMSMLLNLIISCTKKEIICFESKQYRGSYVFLYDDEFHDIFGNDQYYYDNLGNLKNDLLSWESDTCYIVKQSNLANKDTFFFCNYSSGDYYRGFILDIIATSKNWIVFCSYPKIKEGLYKFEITKSEQILFSGILHTLRKEIKTISTDSLAINSYVTWIYNKNMNINQFVDHNSNEDNRNEIYASDVILTIAVNHIKDRNKINNSKLIEECKKNRERFYSIGDECNISVSVPPPPIV